MKTPDKHSTMGTIPARDTYTHTHTFLKEEKVREISVFELRVQAHVCRTYTHKHIQLVNTRTSRITVRCLNRTERADFYSVWFSISFELDVIFKNGRSKKFRLLHTRNVKKN